MSSSNTSQSTVALVTRHRTAMRVLLNSDDAAKCSVALGDLVSLRQSVEPHLQTRVYADGVQDSGSCGVGFGVVWLGVNVPVGCEYR